MFINAINIAHNKLFRARKTRIFGSLLILRQNSSSHKISRVTHESRYETSSALKGEE